jgi:hypothetical protein
MGERRIVGMNGQVRGQCQALWCPGQRDLHHGTPASEPLILPPVTVLTGDVKLFFNAGLSFAEKIEKWRELPTTSAQLVTSELMLALLAVALLSMR